MFCEKPKWQKVADGNTIFFMLTNERNQDVRIFKVGEKNK